MNRCRATITVEFGYDPDETDPEVWVTDEFFGNPEAHEHTVRIDVLDDAGCPARAGREHFWRAWTTKDDKVETFKCDACGAFKEATAIKAPI